MDEQPQMSDGDITQMLVDLNPYEAAILDLIVSRPERRTIVKENFIWLIGQHPNIINRTVEYNGIKIKIDTFMPDYPSASVVAKNYAKSITPIKILQTQFIKQAHDSGIVAVEQERIYVRNLNNKISAIMLEMSNAGLIDVGKLQQAVRTIEHEDGTGFRKISSR